MDMTGSPGVCGLDAAGMARLEEQLTFTLAEAADRIEHMDCFDQEQRAEIYTILEALRADTETHRARAALLARQLTGKVADV